MYKRQWHRYASLAVSSADIGCVVNLERMALAIDWEGMTLSGPLRTSCFAVFKHPPRILVMTFVKWLVKLGRPAFVSGMARMSLRYSVRLNPPL